MKTASLYLDLSEFFGSKYFSFQSFYEHQSLVSLFITFMRSKIFRVFSCICVFLFKVFMRIRFLVFFSKHWQGPEFQVHLCFPFHSFQDGWSFKTFIFHFYKGQSFIAGFFGKLCGGQKFLDLHGLLVFFFSKLYNNQSF